MKEMSRGNFEKVGVLHTRPPAHDVTAVITYRKPLPTCFGRARALPLRGRGTQWRRYRVNKRGKRSKIKTTPLTLKGTGGSFLFRGGLANNLLSIVF